MEEIDPTVLRLGSNDVRLCTPVDAPSGAVMVVKSDGGGEHWVLANPKHLRRVDLEGRTLLVDWPADSPG